jgi:hypothetical protein
MAEMLPSNKSPGQVTTPLKPETNANTYGRNPFGRTVEINLIGTWFIRPSLDCQPGR